MAVSMGTAITEVRALLNETTPAMWTDAQLASWINQGCSDVARRAEILWQQTSINVVANVQNYAFPNDFLNAHRAEFTLLNSMQTQKLDYHPVNDMDQYWGVLQQLPAAWPNYFTIRGNSAVGFYMQLYPVPGAPGNLIVDYYRQAVAVPTSTASTSTATPIDTMSGWEDIVYDYAVYKASRASKNPMWQDGLQLYEKNLQSMIDKTRHMTDEGGNEITGPTPFMPLYLFQYGPDGY